MNLTRTDVTSLMAIAVGGMVGLAAFGPHHVAHSFSSTIVTSTITTVTVDEATSDLEPLVYVDGVRAEGMPDLDPDGIERIEVLKGAAAIELYGEDASNGVVQIFLKDATADTGR